MEEDRGKTAEVDKTRQDKRKWKWRYQCLPAGENRQNEQQAK